MYKNRPADVLLEHLFSMCKALALISRTGYTQTHTHYLDPHTICCMNLGRNSTVHRISLINTGLLVLWLKRNLKAGTVNLFKQRRKALTYLSFWIRVGAYPSVWQIAAFWEWFNIILPSHLLTPSSKLKAPKGEEQRVEEGEFCGVGQVYWKSWGWDSVGKGALGGRRNPAVVLIMESTCPQLGW